MLEHTRRPARGVALLVVVMLLLIGSLAALGVSRLLLLGEAMVGNGADRQRTLAAAEALMRDAETDVLGRLDDGAPCHPGSAPVGCRDPATGPSVPLEPADMDRLRDALPSDPSLPCHEGLCAPDGPARLADIENRLPVVTDALRVPHSYATYGQHTGAPLPAADGAGNRYLRRNAWYWIEVFSYPAAVGIAGGALWQPGPERPFVFRITAIVRGNRPGTRVVLREIFVPASLASPGASP